MSNSIALLPELEAAIGYVFKNQQLLETALTHESYAHEQGSECANNECLEFLGDSILGAVVCLYLYKAHPNSPEGSLAQVKAFVASTFYLSEKAKVIGLGNYLRMGRGEIHSHGSAKPNVLADAMEALIGAMYLDGGFEPVQRFVLSLLKEAMDKMEGSQRDYKTLMQELTQRVYKCLPVYRVVGEEGPPHAKIFRMQISLSGQVIGCGEGRTKQEAGQHAAKQALEYVRLMMGFDIGDGFHIVTDDNVVANLPEAPLLPLAPNGAPHSESAPL